MCYWWNGEWCLKFHKKGCPDDCKFRKELTKCPKCGSTKIQFVIGSFTGFVCECGHTWEE